ncbi:hypothetical protein VCRA2123O444_100083 [Vibrio crassostreae]|nr:hypothetical protein VCRA2119O431_100082 [Vibrio crassostreae]CAK1699427.1 hypothetical protein VCRA2114O422_100072 [Vibrio crassostreae]CAK1717401.1 hypothetical protein VCRA2119O430_110073 [Vibrio crassostreae]CAK1718044.1 hypothetical protein VCRA2113O409_110073 [Vibrio crassostreae]CAK1735606.1 hypothetical protein VCRA2117O428_120083 [Vibrio crassostreae]
MICVEIIGSNHFFTEEYYYGQNSYSIYFLFICVDHVEYILYAAIALF